MFEPVSYRHPGAAMFATLLLLVAASCLPDPAQASDRFRDSRDQMIRLIEADVRSTSHYLKQSSLDPRVFEAMAKVPRHEFVPPQVIDKAYQNRPLPIGHGQTISQPYIVAIMTDLLDVEPDHRILEIGTGSGYQAAVLAEIGARVWSIEIIEALGIQVKTRLPRLGYDQVEVRLGDGYYGWPEHAGFDAIIVTAAASHVPPPLLQQLKPGGKMIIPVGNQFSTQQLVLITRGEDDEFITRQVLPVRFVPLTGKH
jgi:protein-L-isoaspartate(D-aspartate) O-methyltransferase